MLVLFIYSFIMFSLIKENDLLYVKWSTQPLFYSLYMIILIIITAVPKVYRIDLLKGYIFHLAQRDSINFNHIIMCKGCVKF